MTGKRSLILFAILLHSLIASAEPDSTWSFGFRPQYGFLIAHRPSMVHLIQHHIPSFELYAERSLGKKDWHKNFGYPSHGVAFYAGNLANPQLIGNGFALIHYANLHFIRKTSFEWNIRLGTGVGYVTKPFDRLENNKNNAIGTHFNGIMSIQTQLLFKHQHLDYGFGISMLHFSNGSFKMPNLGINMPAVFLDARYHFGKADYPKKGSYELPAFTKSVYAAVLFSGGTRELGAPDGPKYGCLSLESFAAFRFSRKFSVLGGIDVMNNGSLRTAYHTEFGVWDSKWDFTQAGVMAGLEMNMDQLKISFQWGNYVMSKYKGDGPFYHRLAIRYFFGNNIIAQVALKTHFAKADYLEAGIGYRFFQSEKKKGAVHE
ncbi:MAG: acyloxyacyl hydrolase [Flavobacteriales bacterium]|nr:acyloxyacyl hydrolase [Flavobacteriales bacterium]